jgi:2-dehydropantoate 2-reductase
LGPQGEKKIEHVLFRSRDITIGADSIKRNNGAFLETVYPLKTGSTQWHLLGAGSLGCLFAASLQRAGVALELIVRDAAALHQLRANNGIALTRTQGPLDNKSPVGESVTVAIAASTTNSIQTAITHLLICTKAQQTLDAIAAIKSSIVPDAIIVLLQNGMGVRELLQRELPHATIFHALSTEGAFRTARFAVTHAGHGETLIGSNDAEQQTLAQHIVQSLQCELPIIFAHDIELRLWLKLAVNSVINPLTALHRCRNGELTQIINIEKKITLLCAELAQVARAEHIELNTMQMHNEVYRVIHTTANNKSSMLQDIEAGRASEIDFINGYIVQRAHRHGLSCPHHKQLLHAVRALQP